MGCSDSVGQTIGSDGRRSAAVTAHQHSESESESESAEWAWAWAWSCWSVKSERQEEARCGCDGAASQQREGRLQQKETGSC